ncbi:MAG: relaxase/mobilization nuclease domain-containing protein [Alphaproteobacteria bacterium]
MLIFGASVGDWKEKAAYALDKADNEFAEIRDIRCEGIDDVPTALAFMAALAVDTKCIEFLYHATINLYRGERLTREQWMKAIDRLEKNLGLEGHYRIAFEHIKKDRQHYHIYWLRLPPAGKSGPAVNMGNNYRIHEATAIALEKEFGLKPAPRRQKNKPSRKKEEINQRNGKTRISPDLVTKEVTKIYHDSKTTKDFLKNLGKAGYTMTRGKQDKLVLVDKKGGYHGLMRRIDGVKAGDFKKKFPELETMVLPSLASVLRSRRPPSRQTFRKVAHSVSRTRPSYKAHRTSHRTGHNPYMSMPKVRSLTSIWAEARSRYRPKEERKHYPAPVMRKRRRKKSEENTLARGGPTRAEIENAELLCWAWENHRIDILSQFGIILLSDNPTLSELVQHGLIPPDALEP